MAELTFNESYRTHGFVIEIGAVHSVPVTKVTGLNEGSTDTIEQIDGGASYAHKIASGVVKFDTLVIERNMDGSTNDKLFQDWFNEMFQLQGNSGGSSVRHTSNAYGQRVWKRQPLGTASGVAMSPRSTTRRRPRAEGSATGIAESSASV